ncbi:hypothetical protein [Neptuniibacter sp.]|uniref:hypothetical protein n=1 Tax=Neptuniibacter sp. TaxID=1962643 RepID=UPI00262C87F2|nr:hypothetical protein [Neptuniibacter sp.]MCP4598278.1 hypothetical protein [Neptuniibacter sp.]
MNTSMFRPLVVVAISSLLTVGCTANKPKQVATFDTSETFQASKDEVWGKLVRFMSTNQLGISTIEKDSGLLVINNQNVAQNLLSSYCDSGSAVPFLWVPVGGKVSGNVTVVEDEGFSTASINISFNQVSEFCYQGCKYTTKQCQSLGSFEKALLSSLR